MRAAFIFVLNVARRTISTTLTAKRTNEVIIVRTSINERYRLGPILPARSYSQTRRASRVKPTTSSSLHSAQKPNPSPKKEKLETQRVPLMRVRVYVYVCVRRENRSA